MSISHHLINNLIILFILINLVLFITTRIKSNKIILKISMFASVGTSLILNNFAYKGLVIIIVYVGAIAILFLFTIKVVPYNGNNSNYSTLIYIIIIAIIFITLYPDIDYQVSSDLDLYVEIETATDLNKVGSYIYITSPMLILILGKALFIVLVGILAILVT